MRQTTRIDLLQKRTTTPRIAAMNNVQVARYSVLRGSSWHVSLFFEWEQAVESVGARGRVGGPLGCNETNWGWPSELLVEDEDC